MDNLQEDVLSFILLQGVRSKDMRNDRLLAEGMKKGRKEGGGGKGAVLRRLPSVEAPRELRLLRCLELGMEERGSPIHATTVGQRPNEEGGGERADNRQRCN